MDDSARRQANIAQCHAMFSVFAPFDPQWVARLHPDIVMEFPFGAAVGLPGQVIGKEHCVGLFQLVATKLGLTFSNIEILGMADPDMVLALYSGEGAFDGTPYRQKYITMLRFQDGQLVLYREFVDTQVVAEAFGHLSAIV
ncbi:MAG: nuclear transport factor 2 family protein [Pseudomonadota bacterium]